MKKNVKLNLKMKFIIIILKNKNSCYNFSKPASSVKHLDKVAYVVSRADLVELNKRIEPLLRQNQRERDESFEAARDVVVK